jgi:hypothetical protein
MNRLTAILTIGGVIGVQAAILDRIGVTVGKHVIAESDVIRDLRVAAFLDQRPLDLSGAEKRKSADRLVDQYLILQDAALSRLPLPTDESAAAMLQQVKSQYRSDADYQAALVRYEISEGDVSSHLLAGVRALRYTDLRFRPEIQVSDEEVRDFYNTLAADWRKKDPNNVPSFEESREQTEKLLTDQRTAQALDRWLGTQRNETQILYREQVFQ